MPDRNLREKDRALAQRLAVGEARTRALNLRAWPGAVRSEQTVTSFIPTAYNSYSIMLSLSIPAGRWIAFASATLVVPGVTAVVETYVLSAFAFDLATGTAFADDAFDNPSSLVSMPANAAGDTMFASMVLHGDLVAPESCMVTLAIGNISNTPFQVSEPRLRMMPV